MGVEVRPSPRSSRISNSQLPLQFSSTAPAVGGLIPTAPRSEVPAPMTPLTPVNPVTAEATKARSTAVGEDIEDRGSPYAGEPGSFPNVI